MSNHCVGDQDEPTADNPSQPDLEDSNFNYAVDVEDPTNAYDAQGNITATPLEMWELPSAGVEVQIQPPQDLQFGLLRGRSASFQPWTSPVPLTYYPYGNDEISQQLLRVDNAQCQEFNGVNYCFSVERALRQQKVQGYYVTEATIDKFYKNVPHYLIVLDDTMTIVAVWDFVFVMDGEVFPERRPWYGVEEDEVADRDLGKLNELPWSEGFFISGLNSKVTGQFSGCSVKSFANRVIENGNRWQISNGKFAYSGIDMYTEDTKDLPAYYRYPGDTQELGFDYGRQVNSSFYRYLNAVWWDEPADISTGGTITANVIVNNCRKWARWAYTNKSMPLGLLDKVGYQKEFKDRTGNPPSGLLKSLSNGVGIYPTLFNNEQNSIITELNGKDGRVSFSPSGDRVAIPISLGDFPRSFYFDGVGNSKIETPAPSRLNDERYKEHHAIMILERVAGEWEPYNIVTDPYWYTSDIGPIQNDGSYRTYNGPSNPIIRWRFGRPIWEWSDEDTLEVTYFSENYDAPFDLSRGSKYYTDKYSITVTSGSGDFISGPVHGGLTRTDFTFLDFTAKHPDALYYQSANDQNPLIWQSNFAGDGNNGLRELDPQYVAEYNGFTIAGFKEAPLVPNLSYTYNLEVDFRNPTISSYRERNKHRRAMAGIGQVAAFDSQGSVVKRWEPFDARQWVAFRGEVDGPRFIGRKLLTTTKFKNPEDEVFPNSITSTDVYFKRNGASVGFGERLYVHGNILWIYQKNLYTDFNLNNLQVSPAGGTWVSIDLSTVPELNP
jgi:hypothetical protein